MCFVTRTLGQCTSTTNRQNVAIKIRLIHKVLACSNKTSYNLLFIKQYWHVEYREWKFI